MQVSVMSVARQTRKRPAYYDQTSSTTTPSKTPGTERDSRSRTSEESTCEDRRSPDRSRQVNRTALSRSGTGSRLTLQRRSQRNTGAERPSVEPSQSSTPAPEKRLTLQRRTGTGSVGKSTPDHRGVTAGAGPHPRTPTFFSLKHKEEAKREKVANVNTPSTPIPAGSSATGRTVAFKTPTRQTRFEAVTLRREYFEELARTTAVSRPPNNHRNDQHTTTTTTTTTTTNNNNNMENIAVTVAVRVRPFNAREMNTSQVIFIENQETFVRHPDFKQRLSFNFDFAFCSIDERDAAFASQQTVYEKVARPLLLRALEGFNICVFAYGQTGSGKSYTMMGYKESAGIIPRFCQELFEKLTTMEDEGFKSNVELSFCEVYNEKIHDLLVTKAEPQSSSTSKMPLRVREHPTLGTYVAELSSNVVSSESDIQGWLALGNKLRATASTGMNDKSSRSHSILTLVLRQIKTVLVAGQEHNHCITSRINLVDLAGSERSQWPANSDRFREGKNINKSLLTLGKVISALSEQSEKKKTVFVPYRDSILTWLLKDSLGGNSHTAMIATVSPAESCMNESLSTLRYAQKTGTIVNVANINDDTSSKLIRELKEEVEKLQAARRTAEGTEMDRVRFLEEEISTLNQKLLKREQEIADANRELKEKLNLAEARKRRETQELQKAGVTFQVDSRLPCLVNLNEDPQLTEMLLYIIKKGQTTVGKFNSCQDIQLTGGLIADHHCVIWNIDDTVTITPTEQAKTYVNGNIITESTVLHHGDRVILGGNQYFRFNHPLEAKLLMRASRSTRTEDGPKDFEFAKNELLAAQNAQLADERLEAKMKVKEDMLNEIKVAQELAQKEQALESTPMVRDQDRERLAHETEEQEVIGKRKRPSIEARGNVCQSKIVAALEEEKKKITKDLQEIYEKRAKREHHTQNVSPQWNTMKLSLLIEEANAICTRLNKHLIFSRHETTEGDIQVRIQNTNLGIATYWSPDKVHEKIIALRELEKEDFTSKHDDVFCDPDDEWEHDLSSPSPAISTLSHQRKRRVSMRILEKQAQRLDEIPSESAGLGGRATSSSTTDRLPAVCRQLIGQSLSRLHDCNGTEESLAEKIIADLNVIDAAVKTISKLYNQVDNLDSIFAENDAAQTALIKGTAAVDRAGFICEHWLASVRASSDLAYPITEELKSQVKKMGGFLLMLIQACEADITAIVTEVNKNSGPCLKAALLVVGHLAAVTGTSLHAMELDAQATGKGIGRGVHSLFVEILNTSKDMWEDIMKAESLDPVQRRLKSKAVHAVLVLQDYFNHLLLEIGSIPEEARYTAVKEEEEEEEEEATASRFQDPRSISSSVFKLHQAVKQLKASLSGAMRGRDISICSKELISSAEDMMKLLSDLSQTRVLTVPFKLPDLELLLVALQKLSSWK